MKLLKKVCLLVVVCAMMFGASSLLTACANQSETNTTIETRPVVADPEYEVKSPYNLISYGHGLYYEEVDPSDRRSTDELPADYIQIEYLQSTWKQWIDTGYIPNIETQIEAKFFVPTNFGAQVPGSDIDQMYYNYVLYSNRVNLRYQSVSIGGYSRNYTYLRENLINEIFLSSTSYTLTANGTQYENLSFSATTFGGATSLRIFRSIDSELNCYTKPGFKLYSLKISEKDSTTGDVTYVRDFVPCVKDNEAGLFDVVEQKFYTNEEGNGSFNMHNDMLGSGTENDPYQISCIGDLISFYGIANGDEYYVVTTDIKLNDGYFEKNADGTCAYHDGGDGILYDWANPCVFFKKFDGGNHKFENFYSTSMGFLTLAKYNAVNWGYTSIPNTNVEVCNVELSGYYTDENASLVLGKNVAMMFTSYYQKTTATVSNCKVDGCVYITQNNIYRASLLCTWWLYSSGSTSEPYGIMNMKNCVASGNVKAKEGCGLCAYNKNAVSVSNCINFANVSAVESSAAGIIHNEYYYGGNLTLENCKNYGKITGYNGAAGCAISNKGTYKNCYNYGDVFNPSTKTASNQVSQAGGIVAARYRNPELYYKFYSCGNEGNVTALGKVAAGIFGCESYSGTPSQMYFENCYNKGDICAKSDFAVGISGYLRNAKNCTNYGNVYTKVISNSSGSASGLFRLLVNNTEPYLINCVNYGNVFSPYAAATGIIMQVNVNNYQVVIYGCNNYGNISCSQSNSAIGLLTVGGNVNLKIRNCANYGNIVSSSYAGGILYVISSDNNQIIDIENCANYGKLTGGQYVGGIEVGYVSSTTLSIRNCISAGEIKHKYNALSSCFPIYHTTGAGIRATAKNCIVDCKVLGQQKKQFWGDDFSGFFLNRMTSKIGLSAFERVGRYMTPIPSASYLENDLNFTRVA